jgi:HEAT repeat protein
MPLSLNGKMLIMKYLALIILLLSPSAFATMPDGSGKHHANSQPLPLEQPQDVDELLRRLKDERLKNLLDGAFWTVSHDYAEFKHMEEVLKSVQTYFEAIGKYEQGDRSSLDQLGGVKAFKDKLAGWLNDDDQAIRAFAAVMLGISGDKSYTPQLAILLKERESDNDHPRYDRGRAAMALGLVGAQEYTSELVNLLNSSNEYDRVGAAYGLGWLGAKDQAKAVAKLLHDKDEGVREAAKESLEMMGATGLIKDK